MLLKSDTTDINFNINILLLDISFNIILLFYMYIYMSYLINYIIYNIDKEIVRLFLGSYNIILYISINI